MKLVWPDTTVEDVGLARNISLLRKALEDESGQYIETIPRRGYRFAAEPPEQGRGNDGGWRWLAASWRWAESSTGSSMCRRGTCREGLISPAWPWSRLSR